MPLVAHEPWTIRARALVKNPTGFLTPGMFGHMRRFESQPVRAMLIPDESVVNDQTRQIAYVVGDDGVVQQRNVELADRPKRTRQPADDARELAAG